MTRTDAPGSEVSARRREVARLAGELLARAPRDRDGELRWAERLAQGALATSRDLSLARALRRRRLEQVERDASRLERAIAGFLAIRPLALALEGLRKAIG